MLSMRLCPEKPERTSKERIPNSTHANALPIFRTSWHSAHTPAWTSEPECYQKKESHHVGALTDIMVSNKCDSIRRRQTIKIQMDSKTDNRLGKPLQRGTAHPRGITLTLRVAIFLKKTVDSANLSDKQTSYPSNILSNLHSYYVTLVATIR
jgi:hypothetical protein